jgi:hypothetical protein
MNDDNLDETNGGSGNSPKKHPISVVLQPIKMRSSKPSHKHMTYCVTTLV